MRLSQLLFSIAVVCALSLVGCDGSKETATISGSELQQFAETHADEMAELERIEAREALADLE